MMGHMTLLDRLGEETFGEQLRRVRLRGGWTAREVAERVSDCWPVTHALLHRLENETAPPSDRRRRIIAALYAVALGYEPEVFGLSRDEIPRGIDVESLAEGADLLSGKPGWVTAADCPTLALILEEAA